MDTNCTHGVERTNVYHYDTYFVLVILLYYDPIKYHYIVSKFSLFLYSAYQFNSKRLHVFQSTETYNYIYIHIMYSLFIHIQRKSHCNHFGADTGFSCTLWHIHTQWDDRDCFQISWTPWVGFEPASPELGGERLNHYATKPSNMNRLSIYNLV